MKNQVLTLPDKGSHEVPSTSDQISEDQIKKGTCRLTKLKNQDNENLRLKSGFTKSSLIYSLAAASLLLQETKAQTINLALQSSFPHTDNDGVTPDQFLSFIQLNGQSGISVPLEDIKLNSKTSYTSMIWFKPTDVSFSSSFSYLLGFENSLQCYFGGSGVIMCQSDNVNERLSVSTSQININQWIHLTVAGSVSKAQSYVQLEQAGKNILSSDQSGYVNLIQTDTPWEVCIGGCPGQDFGFIGGIRDFITFSTFVNSTQAAVIKNQRMFWDDIILAYYRFSIKDPFGHEMLAETAQIRSGSYSIISDYQAINDICYPISSSISLYKFQTTSDFRLTALDGRYNPASTNWGFTISMWLYLNKTTCYTSSISNAASSCHLLYLQDVLMIFMPAPNQIAVYFYTQKAYYLYQTPSVFVPYNEWINLQFLANMYEGYDLRVYDILNTVIDRQKESRTFQSLTINNKIFNMFTGFVGQVKNVLVYPVKKSLPLNPPYVDFTAVDPIVVANDCLFYFEFNTFGQVTNGPYYIKNLCKHYTYGTLNVYFTPNVFPAFTGQYWKTYTSASSDGLVGTSQKLFDGVACNDGDVVPMINSTSGSIKVNALSISTTQANVTVEFWFKTLSPAASTNYLFSLYGTSKTKEYFSVFYQSSTQKLICAPFGYLSTTSPIIGFTGFTEANRQVNGWFHLSCQYESQKDVTGYLFNTNNLEETQTLSISTTNTIVQSDTYQMIIGSDSSLLRGTSGALFREARFWLVKRTAQDIRYWRFRQLNLLTLQNNYANPQQALQIYMRLSEGSYQEINAAKFINSSASNRYPDPVFTNIAYRSDSQLVVCPQSTFRSESDSQCYIDPVQYVDGAIYPVYFSSNQTLYWLFSAKESVMMDSSVVNQILANWTFSDDATQELITKSISLYRYQTINLLVPATIFREQSTYQVTLNYTNSDQSYQEEKSFNFVPRTCQYFIVSGSDAYQSYLNYSLQQSKFDITFTLQPVSLSSCSPSLFYNTMVQSVKYRFSPPLTYTPDIQFTFNSDSTIKVTIPATQQAKFPLETDVQIIFSLQYDNSYYLQMGVATSGSKIFQNVKQTIYFQRIGQSLTTTVSSNATEIFNGQGVQLSASTIISNSDQSDYARLTYSWKCPTILASACSGATNSLVINATQFKSSGALFQTAYSFQAVVLYTDATGFQSNDTKNISITWYNIDSPVFTIAPPSKLLSTADNSPFTLTFSAYPTISSLPPTLSITWSFSPTIASSLQTLSEYNTKLIIKSGGLAASTSYTLTVLVKNTVSGVTAQHQEVYSFVTSAPPSGGSVSINPSVGYVNQTNLTVSITSWTSSSPLVVFRVWSTTNSAGTMTNIALSSWVQSSNTFRFVPNDTYPYLIEVSDNSGESVWVKNSPTITVQTAQTTSLLSQLISMQQTLQVILDDGSSTYSSKYTQLASYAQSQLNSSTSSLAQSDASVRSALTSVKLTLVNQLLNDTASLNTEDILETDQVAISQGIFQVLTVILYDNYTLNMEIVLKSVQIVDIITKQDDQTVQSLMRDSAFLQNYAVILSGLMKFEEQYTLSQTASRRYLADDSNQQLTSFINQMKSSLENQLCKSAVENQIQQKMQTSSFELTVQKFTMDTTLASSIVDFATDKSSSMVFQISKIAAVLSQQSSSILDQFCIISTLSTIQYSINSGLLRYSNHSATFSVLNMRTMQSYAPTSLISPQDTVQVSFQVVPSTFLSNQTICAISVDNLWSDEDCLTEVDVNQVAVQCKCQITATQNQSFSYALVNNLSREQGEAFNFKDVSTNDHEAEITDSSIDIDSSYSFLMMAAFLLLIATGLPTLSYILDRRDYSYAMSRVLDKHSLRIIHQLARLSELPFKYLLMRNAEIQEITLGLKSSFSQTLSDAHPILGILQKYTPEQPRMARSTTLLFQISLYALALTLFFGPSYRQGQQRLENGLDYVDIKAAIIAGSLGMLFLVEAAFITRLFEKKILTRENKNYGNGVDSDRSSHDNYQSSEERIHKISPDKDQNTHQQILQDNATNNLDNQSPSIQLVANFSEDQSQQELVLKQSHPCLFYLTIILAYLACIASIVLNFLNATQMPISNQYCLVSSFYIGVIGSIMFTNMLRVLMNTVLAPVHSKSNSKCKRGFLEVILAQEAIKSYRLQAQIQEIKQNLEGERDEKSQKQLISQKLNESDSGHYRKSTVQLQPASKLNGRSSNLKEEGQDIASFKEISMKQEQHYPPELMNSQEDHQAHSLSIHSDHEMENTSQERPLSPQKRKLTLKSEKYHSKEHKSEYALSSSIDVRADSIESDVLPSFLENNIVHQGFMDFTKNLKHSQQEHNDHLKENDIRVSRQSLHNSAFNESNQNNELSFAKNDLRASQRIQNQTILE